MEIGSAIKLLRKKRSLTQKELAGICEISANALGQIEKNVSFPQKNTINKICEALDYPVSYLLFFSISEDDIPNDKKDVFNSLNSAIKTILVDSN